MLQDALVIVGMLFLRIGLPILFTVGVGYAIKRVLSAGYESRPGVVVTQQTAAGAPLVRRLQCWEVKKCDEATRQNCTAFKRADIPCWLARQLDGQRLKDACYNCAFYQPAVKEKAA